MRNFDINRIRLLAKRMFYLLGIMAIYCACSETQNEERDRAKQSINGKLDFDGVWIDENYYSELLSSKSPYIAQKKYPYDIITITSGNESQDEFKMYEYHYRQTEVSPTQHYQLDGEKLYYRFESFDKKRVSDTCFENCKTLSIESHSNNLILKKVQGDSVQNYVRIDSHCLDTRHDCEVLKLITSNLLSGTYRFLDSNLNTISKSFRIDENGIVNGYEPFYRLIIWNFYYESNHLFEFDVLEVISTKASSLRYGYFDENQSRQLYKLERVQDTIKWVETKFNRERNEVDTGDVVYYLVLEN